MAEWSWDRLGDASHIALARGTIGVVRSETASILSFNESFLDGGSDDRCLDCLGRATALAFAREGHQIIVSGSHGDAGEELPMSSARRVLRRSSSAPTCAMTMRCGI
jgi:hypothetical protein